MSSCTATTITTVATTSTPAIVHIAWEKISKLTVNHRYKGAALYHRCDLTFLKNTLSDIPPIWRISSFTLCSKLPSTPIWTGRGIYTNITYITYTGSL